MTNLDTLRSRLTAAGQRWVIARQRHAERLADARGRIADAHAKRDETAAELAALAREATDAGISENETAALLGVSRARTLRRWLGK